MTSAVMLMQRLSAASCCADGHAKALPTSVWWAAAGGLAHMLSQSVSARGGVKGILSHYNLLDAPEGKAGCLPLHGVALWAYAVWTEELRIVF